MAEFKTSISDPKARKAYQGTVSGSNADAIIGKGINDEIDGIFLDLPSYKLVVTGGSDGSGVPMRGDISGPSRRRLLLSDSTGFVPAVKGQRKRKLVRGRQISADTSQINFKITEHGPKSIGETLNPKEAPAKEAPAKEAPAKEAPAKEAPAKEAPAKEAPAKEAPEEE